MDAKKRPRKPYNMDEYKIPCRESSFQPLSLFHSSQETRIQDGYGNARCQSLDPVPIKLAKNQLNTSWAVSTRFIIYFGESFYFYCFLMLFVVQ